MSDLTVSVINSHDQLQRLAPQWNTLLEDSVSGSFFLTWEWQSAWAECFLGNGRRLFVLAVRENETLVGVAPFYLDRKKHGPMILREVRFLGSPEAGSDYLEVFSRKGREKAVADAIYDFLLGEAKGAWDLVRLEDIPADALFLLHFMNRIEVEGKYAEISLRSYCPVAKLPDSEDNFFTMLSRGTKKKFKQDIRVINREHGVAHSVIQGEGVAKRLDDFIDFYEEKAGWSGKGLSALLHRFLEKCDGEKPVQINLLSVNDQVVAGLLHLKRQNTLAMYLMAVNKEFNPKVSLGQLLVGLCIRNAINEGYSSYDFLKGDEMYKFSWAKGGRRSLQLVFWQRRPAAVASALGKIAKHAGKLILR